MDEDFTIDPEIRNLFKQISNHIRSRMKLIVALFIIGIAIGIPISHRVVDWLLEVGLVPEGVNIIILTPVEFIMLQVRVGAWLGAGLAVLALIVDGAWKSGLAKKSPRPAFSVIVAVVFAIILATAGLIYSWYLLTPMLLDYLATDAQSAGLSTEWRLSSFIGFIISLCLACVIGFQAPLITMLSLQSGAVDRATLLAYRRHIWFTTFVLGAAFSPPDPLSLFLVSLPIILLFEAALIWDNLMGGSKGVNA
ncbi:MAG: twin-arginine translocase subunit TatC [Candidatus Poseidoniaceae archaeon]|jgi:sec-independent protein translocase protein TatC|nr:twin-arginine translocase subunit TatC [Candidatus Poseidoniaceae archaeon]